MNKYNNLNSFVDVVATQSSSIPSSSTASSNSIFSSSQDSIYDSSNDLYSELITFLSDLRLPVQVMALEGILSFSENEEFLKYARENATEILKKLFNFIETEKTLSEVSMKVLINLSAEETLCECIIKMGGIEKTMDNLIEQKKKKKDILCRSFEELNLMFLSNLTRHADGIDKILLKDDQGNYNSYFIIQCLNYYLSEIISSSDNNYKDKHLWIGQILRNISTTEHGCACIIELGCETLNALSNELKNTDRRVDIIDVFCNICRFYKFHEILCDSEVTFIPRICTLVYPLDSEKRNVSCKNMVFQNGIPIKLISDKTIENSLESSTEKDSEEPCQTKSLHKIIDEESCGLIESTEMRFKIFECFFLLSKSKDGRKGMRFFGVYEVFRVWHLLEENIDLRCCIENIVHLVYFTEKELEEQDAKILKHKEKTNF